MAYKTHYTKFKKEFPEAYLQVQLILWKITDTEIIEEHDGNEHISWIKSESAEAIVDIYGDKQARMNRVTPLDSIKIKFSYDKHSALNIIQQAYDKLKDLYPIGEDC